MGQALQWHLTPRARRRPLFLAGPGGSSAQDCERPIQSDQDDSDLASTWSFADFCFVHLLPVAWLAESGLGVAWLLFGSANGGFASAVVTL